MNNEMALSDTCNQKLSTEFTKTIDSISSLNGGFIDTERHELKCCVKDIYENNKDISHFKRHLGKAKCKKYLSILQGAIIKRDNLLEEFMALRFLKTISGDIFELEEFTGMEDYINE